MQIEINSTRIALTITTLLCSFLLFQKANALSSPSIEDGNNPIVSSTCTTSYSVPSDKVLVITDFVAYGSSSSSYGSASINENGNALINIGGLIVGNPASIGNFQTGFKAEGGSLVECSTYYAALSWSGYLARP